MLEAGAVADEGEGEVGEVLGAQEATSGEGLEPAFFFDEIKRNFEFQATKFRENSSGVKK